MALFKMFVFLVIVVALSDCNPDTSTLTLGMLLKKAAERRQAGIGECLLNLKTF